MRSGGGGILPAIDAPCPDKVETTIDNTRVVRGDAELVPFEELVQRGAARGDRYPAVADPDGER